MSNNSTTRPAKRWRWLALGTLGVAGAIGGWYGIRQGLNKAQAQQSAAAPQTAAAADYDHRVVAYVYETEPVNRDELAEYLIARRGPEKLTQLVNRRIIETACKARNIEITNAAVDAALSESIRGLNIGRQEFVKQYLKSVQKTLFEWKEDVLRTKLMLTELVRDQVQVSEEEVLQAFDCQYGERIDCRIIVWPKSQFLDAQAEYPKLRDSEEAFAEKAKHQFSPELASVGGKVKPIGHNTFSTPEIESVIFRLQPGEVSTLVPTPDGATLIKCDARLPAQHDASIDAKREELTAAIRERKTQQKIKDFVLAAREKAAVKPAHDTLEGMEKLLTTHGPANQVLVTIYGNVQITRQELGEYLIVRYGPQNLDLLINRKIIDKACQAKGIVVGDKEVEDTWASELKRLNIDGKKFIEDFLTPNGKSLFEWKEDIVRPKLMMTKLARLQTQATEEDLRQAFDAKYGEKIDGRVILWKHGEEHFALRDFVRLRDSEAEFDQAAARQFNPALAAKRGKVPPFARHTSGVDKLEEEAFKLQPGELSGLIELPEGSAVFKCDARIPGQSGVTLDQKREELLPIVLESKTQAYIPVVFNQLHDQAKPRLLLKDPNQSEDLAASVRHDLAPDAPTRPPTRPMPPHGN